MASAPRRGDPLAPRWPRARGGPPSLRGLDPLAADTEPRVRRRAGRDLQAHGPTEVRTSTIAAEQCRLHGDDHRGLDVEPIAPQLGVRLHVDLEQEVARRPPRTPASPCRPSRSKPPSLTPGGSSGRSTRPERAALPGAGGAGLGGPVTRAPAGWARRAEGDEATAPFVLARDVAAPPQLEQTSGAEPPSAPVPPQAGHASWADTWISRVAPSAASRKPTFRLYRRSPPRCGCAACL